MFEQETIEWYYSQVFSVDETRNSKCCLLEKRMEMLLE